MSNFCPSLPALLRLGMADFANMRQAKLFTGSRGKKKKDGNKNKNGKSHCEKHCRKKKLRAAL